MKERRADQRTLSVCLHPSLLQPATFPPFNVYVECEDDGRGFRLFHRSNDPVYVSTREELRRRGVQTLYAAEDDAQSCLEYIETNLDGILAESPSGQHVAGWLYTLTCRAMKRLLSDPYANATHERLRALVTALVGTIGKKPINPTPLMDPVLAHYQTHVHCVNVCMLLSDFGHRLLGVRDPALLVQLGMGGILHDLGKAMIDDDILNKPGKLTPEEFNKIKRHPRYGLGIARPYLRHAGIAQAVISQHHENYAAGGYPEGRAGEAINIFARAARVADVFDALTNDRPYAHAIDQRQALNTMVTQMQGDFDMAILRKFIAYLGSASGKATAIPVLDRAREPMPATAEDSEPAAAPELAHSAPEPSYEPEVVASEPEPSDDGVGVVYVSDPESRRLVMESLVAGWSERSNLLGDIAQAVEAAVDEASVAWAEEAESAPAGPPFGAVRSLFPLIWDLDEQRQAVAARPDAAAAADTLSLIARLREGLVRFLDACNVELMEGSDADERQSSMAELTAGCVRRVGFRYRSGQTSEVLEPPRVVLYPDRRKAG